MPVYSLSEALAFPPADGADPSGLVAVGGDLRPERLLLAYAMGIFPWYGPGQPILWHSPDPRMVLDIDGLIVNRTLRKTLQRERFHITFDTSFDEVVRACATRARPGQDGTWITEEMIAAYVGLHRLGFAHSVEARLDGALVGGLYGVSLGRAFFGESMFSFASDASKVALVALVERLHRRGFHFVDCQVHTELFAQLGAAEIPRATFLARLARALLFPSWQGDWCATTPEAA
jgi:leucyl/phenylalanyl-tRNA---protein transferase